MRKYKFNVHDIVIFWLENKYYIGTITKKIDHPLSISYYIHHNDEELFLENGSKEVEIVESDIVLFNSNDFVIKRKITTVTYTDQLIDFKK